MADTVDMASAIEAENVAMALAGAAKPLRTGAAGECEGCDWWMPRLVDGLCGFCRDGRARPADWEPPQRPPQSSGAISPPTIATETPIMVNSVGSKSITFVAAGDVLAEIKRRTASGEVTNNRAALDLIEAGMTAGTVPASSPLAPSSEPTSLSLDQLLELIRRHFDERPDQSAELTAAIERAEAAEARADGLSEKLALVSRALAA